MFTELVKKRRSIKEYQDKSVEHEKVMKIIEAALRAPSGRAFRPWHFIVVTEKDILERLSVAKPAGAEFIKNAPIAIVVCGDTTKSPVWIEDCCIAAAYIQLAALSLGLGSRWSQMRNNSYDDKKTTKEYIAELLNLPNELEIQCVIAIGYPDEEFPPYVKEELNFDQVSYNRFGQELPS